MIDGGTQVEDIAMITTFYQNESVESPHNLQNIVEDWMLPKGLDKNKRTLLGAIIPSTNAYPELEEILGKIDVVGTSAVEVLKVDTRFEADDLYEYDIAIPRPPPNRRYKVKLNIKSIKKGIPTIVDPDWI